MDFEEILPRRADDPVARLAAQDISPLSVDELEARVIALEQEIARCRMQIRRARDHRTSADALFKK